jgi:epoxyqueuosine reductase
MDSKENGSTRRMELTAPEAIRQQASALGFDWCGFAPVEPSQTLAHYERWLEQGHAGAMEYLRRHAEQKADPRRIVPSALTVIVLACNYNRGHNTAIAKRSSLQGKFSRYAHGADYHLILRERLEQMRQFLLNSAFAHEYEGTRVYVDTGPILEREMAWKAGLGWFGKHSNVIHPKLGSWLFLTEILIDRALPTEAPFAGIDCGSCTRCISACPTQAIVADRTVDARRCISYLTIELKTAIPQALRSSMSNWIFGCDVCQEVCPWNRKSPLSADSIWEARPVVQQRDLRRWMTLTQSEFSAMFQHSPVKRTKRRGLLRNVAVALGNARHPQALPVLCKALHDSEELVRGHAAWALGKFRQNVAQQALRKRLRIEPTEAVRQEIRLALSKRFATDTASQLRAQPRKYPTRWR